MMGQAMEQAIERVAGLVALGGPVVAILMGFSVLALACVIWKALVFQREAVGRHLRRGFAHELLQALRVAREAGAAPGDLRARAEARLDQGAARLSSGLRLLDVISQVAPLLGLFGTVLGMIDAFRTLQGAGGTADPALLAGGIWVALVTTAAGLIVAMPCAMALAWFDGRLERHQSALRDAVEEVLTPKVLRAHG